MSSIYCRAVDKVQKRKHQSAGRKSNVPKLNIEAVQAIQDVIPDEHSFTRSWQCRGVSYLQLK